VARIGGGTHRSYLARMVAEGVRGRRLGPYHRAILWVERQQFSLRGHRRVLAVSDLVRREVLGDYALPAERVAVIYNGVDLDAFHPTRHAEAGTAVRRALAVPAGDRLCVAIGSGFARKGMDILLDLWAERPPARMVLALVGADERLARFRRDVAARGLDGRVRVLGRRDDVPAILAAADALCVPSRQEAIVIVVLEACAAGVPVVTSRLVGAAELLDGPCARLVLPRPDDRTALRDALEEATGPRQATLRMAARVLAERHPWSRHLDDVEALLHEVARA
jgi:UDP-glucose:(heptosyl)LPS alpha-1,3-glucosyltransferase